MSTTTTDEDRTLWLDRGLDMASSIVADGARIDAMVVAKVLLRLNGKVETLFDALVNDDGPFTLSSAHWVHLKAKIEEHFKG